MKNKSLKEKQKELLKITQIAIEIKNWIENLKKIKKIKKNWIEQNWRLNIAEERLCEKQKLDKQHRFTV